MAPNDPGAVVIVDLVQDMLDLGKGNLVLGAEVGTFAEFLNFFVQELAPFLFIVQIKYLVDDMVFIECKSHPVDKSLMENKVVRGKPFVGLTTLYTIPKAQLTVYGQHVKIV